MTRTITKILAVIFAAVTLSSCGYNGMVTKQEQVAKAWADVEAQYQRRADLIPNLVTTVKQAGVVEEGILTAVMDARASATSVKLSSDDLTEENLQKYQAAQGQLSGSLSRLLVSVEAYPQLQSIQGFRDLSAELAGTENRIAKSRKDYNEVVNDYNAYIKQFPRVIFSGMFGFKKKPYFEAKPGTENAPEVKF